MSACELIRYKAVRAHYIGWKAEPFRWANQHGYQYNRPVYRKLNKKGAGRVYPTGRHCSDIRIGWGPIQINPFGSSWNPIFQP